MPRWSAERRAPSVIGRGTPLAMASRRAAARHAIRCGDPHRRLSVLCSLAREEFFSTAPPVRRKAESRPNGRHSVGCRVSIGCGDICEPYAIALPPIHGGKPLALFALREHAGRGRRLNQRMKRQRFSYFCSIYGNRAASRSSPGLFSGRMIAITPPETVSTSSAARSRTCRFAVAVMKFPIPWAVSGGYCVGAAGNEVHGTRV